MKIAKKLSSKNKDGSSEKKEKKEKKKDESSGRESEHDASARDSKHDGGPHHKDKHHKHDHSKHDKQSDEVEDMDQFDVGVLHAHVHGHGSRSNSKENDEKNKIGATIGSGESLKKSGENGMLPSWTDLSSNMLASYVQNPHAVAQLYDPAAMGAGAVGVASTHSGGVSGDGNTISKENSAASTNPKDLNHANSQLVDSFLMPGSVPSTGSYTNLNVAQNGAIGLNPDLSREEQIAALSAQMECLVTEQLQQELAFANDPSNFLFD